MAEREGVGQVGKWRVRRPRSELFAVESSPAGRRWYTARRKRALSREHGETRNAPRLLPLHRPARHIPTTNAEPRCGNANVRERWPPSAPQVEFRARGKRRSHPPDAGDI